MLKLIGIGLASGLVGKLVDEFGIERKLLGEKWLDQCSYVLHREVL